MKKILNIIVTLTCSLAFAASCNFLDVVPEGKATMDDIFKTHVQANNFVASLYSTTYMPAKYGSQGCIDLAAGGDIMSSFYGSVRYFKWKSIIYDNAETPSNTYLAMWSQAATSYPTGYSAYRLWECIRNAYLVLDNAEKVGDATETEIKGWQGEAYWVIGYCHQTLLEYYGPIPLAKELIPLDFEGKDPRAPYLECVQFISDMYDRAAELLPATRSAQYYGRATKTLALTLKARLWLYAASPLVNGNTEWYGNFKNPDGTPLMPQTYDKELWKKAMNAAEEAITRGEADGFKPYATSKQSDPFQRGYEDYRAAFVGPQGSSASFNNEEILLGVASSEYEMKNLAVKRSPKDKDGKYYYKRDGFRGYFVPTFDAVENYLSKNGLPMDVDPETKNVNLYAYNPAAETANLNLNREPRFYASIGYDRGEYDIDGKTIILKCRFGEEQQNSCNIADEYQSCTGYYVKKWISRTDTYNPDNNTFGFNSYYRPYVRFTEAYLDYAEAEAEYTGTLSAKGLSYLNKVRRRAGLPNFEDSWALVGGMPTGKQLVDAIRQERMSEFCLECRWFHDLRRWKTAHLVLGKTPKSWNLNGSAPEDYYQVIDVYEGAQTRTFTAPKNYWLAVPQDQININPNFVQNPGY
ncbi:MAG: RagB/SusD family nutrient uptake outer membrane protein [Bacteroidales bacterium]|nr:RagB/SusD family nutrient uptake outer membrane protein [Bacteroidota bacterium]NLN99530.1 RagB/SusD family nutrient uptake outer membrane protein [Bacteroidales bacterium]